MRGYIGWCGFAGMGFSKNVFEELHRFGSNLALEFKTFAASPFMHLAGYQAGELEKPWGKRVASILPVHKDAIEAEIQEQFVGLREVGGGIGILCHFLQGLPVGI